MTADLRACMGVLRPTTNNQQLTTPGALKGRTGNMAVSYA